MPTTETTDVSRAVRFLLYDRSGLGRESLRSKRRQAQSVSVRTAGLGFRCQSYRGDRLVWRGGGLVGWGARMTLLPDFGSWKSHRLVMITMRVIGRPGSG